MTIPGTPSVPSLVEMGIRIDTLDEKDLDSYPFGIIQLSPSGRILAYNRYEEQMARLRREDVIGRNFFFEIAPCTRVRRFYGRFQEGVSARALHATFGFVFPFAHGERQVEVSMYYRTTDDTVWVIVRG